MNFVSSFVGNGSLQKPQPIELRASVVLDNKINSLTHHKILVNLVFHPRDYAYLTDAKP